MPNNQAQLVGANTFESAQTFSSTIAVTGASTLTGAVGVAGGLTSTVADEANVVGLTVTQNDTTNNPTAMIVTNTGTGADLLVNTDEFVVDGSNVGLGVTAWGTSGTNVLGITADGTVPTTSPAGMIQIYADDSSDGATNATLALRTEQAVEEIGTFTASHKLKIWINGTEYWIQLDAV